MGAWFSAESQSVWLSVAGADVVQAFSVSVGARCIAMAKSRLVREEEERVEEINGFVEKDKVVVAGRVGPKGSRARSAVASAG